MVRYSFRSVVLACAIALTANLARGGDCCSPAPDCCAAGCAAPVTRTICVTEWVPEQYQATRTVCRTEQRQETYTGYRTECVPETCSRTVCVMKQVPEVQTVCRTICETVPTVETRTIMQTKVTCVPVTCMVKKCVDQGHYECREVPCEE